MNPNKLALTKLVILELLGACGPCSLQWIINECKQQAYVSMVPRAIYELTQSQAINETEDMGDGMVYFETTGE